MRDTEQAERLLWVDARYESGKQQVVRLQTYSDTYFELLARYEWLSDYLAQGENVVLVLNGVALETTTEEVTLSSGELSQLNDALENAKGL
jgi:hypothetical protein